MSRRRKAAALAAGLVIAASTSAAAAVFPKGTPAQRLRADVAKQVAAYGKCLVAALLACEKSGASPNAECSLEDGTAVPPANPKGKLAVAIAKCDAKLDYDRKGPEGNTSAQNYELIGCPTGSALGPRLADMNELETIARKAKAEIDAVAAALPIISGCTDTKSCAKAAKVVVAYATAFGKCQTACENDDKGRKGGGGLDDDAERCGPFGDPAVFACIRKANEKFIAKTATWNLPFVLLSVVQDTIDAQTDGLFNAPPNCF